MTPAVPGSFAAATEVVAGLATLCAADFVARAVADFADADFVVADFDTGFADAVLADVAFTELVLAAGAAPFATTADLLEPVQEFAGHIAAHALGFWACTAAIDEHADFEPLADAAQPDAETDAPAVDLSLSQAELVAAELTARARTRVTRDVARVGAWMTGLMVVVLGLERKSGPSGWSGGRNGERRPQ